MALDFHVHKDSGIQSFADPRGKTTGLPDSGMTAGVWLRILLDQPHGVKAGDNRWVNGRPPERRHSELLKQLPPPGVAIRDTPEDATLQDLLDRGEVDVTFGDRMRVPVGPSDTVRPLFTPQQAVQVFVDFGNKTGAGPINHTLLVQRHLAEENPWLARAPYDGFKQSKQLA